MLRGVCWLSQWMLGWFLLTQAVYNHFGPHVHYYMHTIIILYVRRYVLHHFIECMQQLRVTNEIELYPLTADTLATNNFH